MLLPTAESPIRINERDLTEGAFGKSFKIHLAILSTGRTGFSELFVLTSSYILTNKLSKLFSVFNDIEIKSILFLEFSSTYFCNSSFSFSAFISDLFSIIIFFK